MIDPPIKDAATIILLRDTVDGPAVLMGQRGAKAAFMPDKYVFPGGAVDDGDGDVPLATPLGDACARRMSHHSDTPVNAIAVAAIRELWEETGLIMGQRPVWDTPPRDWVGFGATPAAAAMTFVFRAITPPKRTRRFDARFFVADVDAILNDPDDFSDASGELSDLRWIPLTQARDFDLPFVTQIVLAETQRYIARGRTIDTVPFFGHDGDANHVRQLHAD